MSDDRRPRVVIVGAGFGGLFATRALAKTPADVTLIDRHNYHLFQSLLYQVATAGFAPAAKQQGRYVARVITARIKDTPAPPPFRYAHAGNWATIGRKSAVIELLPPFSSAMDWLPGV